MPNKLSDLSITFEIGTTLFIERRLFSQKVKGATTIIGAREPRYLLVGMPQSNSSPMLQTVGEEIIVRFLHQGKMFGFKAEVVKITLDPFPLVILLCPEEVEEMALRQNERLQCVLPSVLALEPWGNSDGAPLDRGNSKEAPPPPLHGTIIDLAEGGCQMFFYIHRGKDFSQEALDFQKKVPPSQRNFYTAESLKMHFTAERPCKMTFEIPEPVGTKFPNVPCEIRWIKTIHMHCVIGLRFRDVNPAIPKGITALIEHQKKYFTSLPEWL